MCAGEGKGYVYIEALISQDNDFCREILDIYAIPGDLLNQQVFQGTLSFYFLSVNEDLLCEFSRCGGDDNTITSGQRRGQIRYLDTKTNTCSCSLILAPFHISCERGNKKL